MILSNKSLGRIFVWTPVHLSDSLALERSTKWKLPGKKSRGFLMVRD